MKKTLVATIYKNNSGLIGITKVSRIKKGLCVTEKLVRESATILIHQR